MKFTNMTGKVEKQNKRKRDSLMSEVADNPQSPDNFKAKKMKRKSSSFIGGNESHEEAPSPKKGKTKRLSLSKTTPEQNGANTSPSNEKTPKSKKRKIENFYDSSGVDSAAVKKSAFNHEKKNKKAKQAKDKNENNAKVGKGDESGESESTQKKKRKRKKKKSREAAGDSAKSDSKNTGSEENEADQYETNKLFVGGLGKDVNEKDLKQQFPKAIKVTVHVKRRGKRYAIIEFTEEKHVKKALKKSQQYGVTIKDKKITVGLVKKKLVRKTPDRLTLYVGNLPKDIEDSKVQSHFPGAKSVRVRKDKTGNVFAFVTFKTESDAKSTMDEKQGWSINGHVIKVDFTAQNENQGDDNKMRTMLVSNLPEGTKGSDLRKLFPEAETVNLPRESDGKVTGTAYVTFATREILKATIEKKQKMRLKKKRLHLSFVASRKKKRAKNREKNARTLKISSFSASSSEIKQHFPGCVHVKIPQLNNGRPKEFAFIEFKSEEEADSALNSKQSSLLNGKKVKLAFVGAKRKQYF